MASVTINGQRFSGSNIVIRGGVVTVDGAVQPGGLTGIVEVHVLEGVLDRLEADGSVTCGEVRGDVVAGGSVTCADIGGSVQAGGSVRSGPVGGSVSAGGSVRHG